MDRRDTVFRHGVASGDPLDDRVLIWTRVSHDGVDPVAVAWRLVDAEDPGRLSRSGSADATADADWTLTVDVEGLEPGRRYRYEFEALGERSPVGRTKTLPAGDVDHIRLAQVSCAKFNAGFFNAYARIAARDDLDFVLHLGDYIYEASNTPPASQTPGADIGRPFDPLHECKTLADYRRRYAQYRSDPDVQAMHAAHPLIGTPDDHEFADGAWRDGASEHREERDGPWRARVADAFRARSEWLPIRLPNPADRERVYRTIRLGNLADLFLIDTRTRRDEPVPPPEMFREDRSALGPEQHAWLIGELDASRAAWRLLGNPSILARTWNDDLADHVKRALQKVKMIDAPGHGPDYDQWDGYPAERRKLLHHIREAGITNLVVLSGDVHVGMAIELADELEAGPPIAIEFVNTSLTSQNLDDKLGWAPLTESLPIAAEYIRDMPYIQWADFDSHGYTIVDVTRERITAEWWAVETVLERTDVERRVAAWSARAGEIALERVDEAVPDQVTAAGT